MTYFRHIKKLFLALSFGLLGCGDAIAGTDFEGVPDFVLNGQIESIRRVQNDDEDAYASLAWLGKNRLNLRPPTQLTKVGGEGFPSSFSLYLFGPPDNDLPVKSVCPPQLLEAIDEGLEEHREEGGASALLNWPLYGELVLLFDIQSYFKRGLRAKDFAYALPEVEALDALPKTEVEHDAVAGCAQHAFQELSGLSETEAASGEYCFDIATIMVFHNPVSRDPNSYFAAPEEIVAHAGDHHLIYVEEPAEVQRDPERCNILIENPEALKAGYNLASRSCATPNASEGTLRIVENESLVLRKGDTYDLVNKGAGCAENQRTMLRAFNPKTTGLGTLPTKLTLQEALADAEHRVSQVDDKAGLSIVDGWPLEEDGSTTSRVTAGQQTGWRFRFTNPDTENAVTVAYDSTHAMLNEPRVEYRTSLLRQNFLPPMEKEAVAQLPDGADLFTLLALNECNFAPEARLNILKQTLGTAAEQGDRLEIQYTVGDVVGRIGLAAEENQWISRLPCVQQTQ